MPILRIEEKLVYFAHVPKCAGTSVERYLLNASVEMAFHDGQHYKREGRPPWSATSPQHVDKIALDHLFPQALFADGFSVVRHPAKRARSAFHYAQKVYGLKWTGFETWLRSIGKMDISQHRTFDNHTLPMTAMVPDWIENIFRLEDGEAAIVTYLDTLLGRQSSEPALPKFQTYTPVTSRTLAGRLLSPIRRPKAPELDERLCRLVFEVYREDYERFGYGWDDPLKGAAHG